MEDVVKKGDFVKIEFTAKTKEDGKIFDTTSEEVAKQAGIYSPALAFRPLPLVVGEKFVIEGLDEALEGKKVGEQFVVEIPPEKGFGKRKPELLLTVSEPDLLQLGIKPEVGKYVRIPTAQGVLTGRIVSISGGRVVLDFNHPLAGKTLIYEVKILEKAQTEEDKVKYLIDFFFPKLKYSLKLEGRKAILELQIDEINTLVLDRFKLLKDFIKKYVANDLGLELRITV
ncbi:MAG: peptidylprolyl isomerase [bacterium]|nr:peptidylprolyl isomerase [bacterium]